MFGIEKRRRDATVPRALVERAQRRTFKRIGDDHELRVECIRSNRRLLSQAQALLDKLGWHGSAEVQALADCAGRTQDLVDGE
jgi:hypothetical protein